MCDEHFQQSRMMQQDSVYFILDSGCDSVTDTETEDEKNPVDSHRLAMSEEHESSKSTGDCPVVQPKRIQCGVLYVDSLGYVLTVSWCNPLCCFAYSLHPIISALQAWKLVLNSSSVIFLFSPLSTMSRVSWAWLPRPRSSLVACSAQCCLGCGVT